MNKYDWQKRQDRYLEKLEKKEREKVKEIVGLFLLATIWYFLFCFLSIF